MTVRRWMSTSARLPSWLLRGNCRLSSTRDKPSAGRVPLFPVLRGRPRANSHCFRKKKKNRPNWRGEANRWSGKVIGEVASSSGGTRGIASGHNFIFQYPWIWTHYSLKLTNIERKRKDIEWKTRTSYIEEGTTTFLD